MMKATSVLIFVISIFQVSTITLNTDVGKCLSDLVTAELTASYNYLQLSSKFGTTLAYPGFSSLFTKLSDDDSSKAHDLVKYLALRKAKLDRLINKDGIQIHDESNGILTVKNGLHQSRNQNKNVWKEVIRCHKEAAVANDANVQDYLESHFLDHHIEIDKLLTDIEHRVNDGQSSEKNLITFMVDEELLQTYGDRRKDIFS
jgi:ferritin